MTERITNNFKPNYFLDNKKLSKQNDKLCRLWAIEANEIDPTKSIGFYYLLFKTKFQEKFIRENLLKKGIISHGREISGDQSRCNDLRKDKDNLSE